VVARFSSRGLVAEEVERAAWEDYVAAGGGRPQDVPLAGAGPPRFSSLLLSLSASPVLVSAVPMGYTHTLLI
jgi:hypothetical protein